MGRRSKDPGIRVCCQAIGYERNPADDAYSSKTMRLEAHWHLRQDARGMRTLRFYRESRLMALPEIDRLEIACHV